jgi:hypothetical protein
MAIVRLTYAVRNTNTLRYRPGNIFMCNMPEVKVKVQLNLEQPVKAQRGCRGNKSTLSLTSALDGVGGQRQAPAALPQGKTRHPLYRRQGGPQGWSGGVRKISPPPPPPALGIRSQDNPARS